MSKAMGAPPKDGALFHEVERLQREIARQFRNDPDAEATPARRLKLAALLDDLDRLLADLGRERDALQREINGVDGAMAATVAYRCNGRLGQAK